MGSFPDILQNANNRINRVSTVRISQRGVMPTAVKGRGLANTLISQTQAEVLGPFSVGNGQQLQVTSTIAATSDESIIVGGVPYFILFGVGTSLAALSFIPFDTAVGDFELNAGMAMPTISGATSVTGSTNSKLTYESLVVNTSGITKNIMCIVNGRYITGSGSGIVSE